MSKALAVGVLVGFLLLTSITFAGLFVWQYLKDRTPDGTIPAVTHADSTNDNVCPFYPEPRPINFGQHTEFGELFSKLETRYSSLVNNKTRPSVVTNLVYRDQVVWSGYFGQMSKNSTEKPDQATIYRMGSISKVFPVLFLFKLWEEGKLELNDAVKKYAPNFSIGRPYGSNTTINLIDLASQISGLPAAVLFKMSKDMSVAMNGTLEEALSNLQSEILVAEPRTECSYSNLAFAILGHVLARNFTEDGDFNAWAQKNVLDVLEMKNTWFTITKMMEKSKLATGYKIDGTEAGMIDLMWYGPAGNYYSSIGDLAKLSMVFLESSPAKLLKHHTLTEMLRTRKTCRQGYPLANYTGSPWEMNKIHSYMVAAKHGDIEGFSSTMALVPDLKLALNVMTSGARTGSVTSRIYAMKEIIPVFRDFLRKLERRATPTPNYEQYVGMYVYPPEIFDLRYNITADSDGRLYMENPTPAERFGKSGLSYISEDTFSLVISGGDFPCMYQSVVNLEMQNGALLHFKNYSGGHYNEFKILRLFTGGFHRQP